MFDNDRQFDLKAIHGRLLGPTTWCQRRVGVLHRPLRLHAAELKHHFTRSAPYEKEVYA